MTGASPKIDAVGVSARDMARSVRFYGLLGFAFGPLEADAAHVEAQTGPGAVRLMIDSAELARSLIGEAPRPGNTSAFALLYESPAAVDGAAGAIEAAGLEVVHPPFDAFWGQRYATVADPDGYRIDLFAPL